jgi:hypothetical protein
MKGGGLVKHLGWKKGDRIQQSFHPLTVSFLRLLLAAGFLLAFPKPAWAIDLKESPSNEIHTHKHSHRLALSKTTETGGLAYLSEKPVQGESCGERDREIEQMIRKEFQKDPLVDEEKLSVTVKNDVAVLEGTVESWTAHAAAEADAFQCGAKKVRNDLKVREAAKNVKR